MDPPFNGSVLGGQAKSIPSNGMQDVVALHVFEACQDIRNGVDAQMAEMHGAGRVREHGQHIGVSLVVLAQLVPLRLQLVPVRLPFRSERLQGRPLSSLPALGSPVGRCAAAWLCGVAGDAPPGYALQTEAHH
jgi:hypothetical protein